MRTNQKSFLNSKPGRYNGNMMFHANAVYYSFTDVAAQSGNAVPSRLMNRCVHGAAPLTGCAKST
jgi:hypothetical protein